VQFVVCKVALGRSLFNVNRRGNVRMNVTMTRVCESIVAVEKQLSIKYSVCVCVASVIQRAIRMSHIALLPSACLAMPYFSTLSYKRHDFRKKKIGHKIWVLVFSTNLSETFLIIRIS
jgi:hypothetical protein